MPLPRKYIGLLGGIFWIAVGVLVFAAWRTAAEANASGAAAPVQQILDYALRPPQRYGAVAAGLPVGRADPIFLSDASGSWRQVGHLRALADDPPSGRSPGPDEPPSVNAVVVWYSADRDPHRYRLEYYRNRGTIDEVVQTLLPADKRARIRRRLAAALQLHGQEIAAAFRPLVEESLRESAPLLEEALRESIRRHRDDFESLGRRWEEQFLQSRIVPLLRQEVLPTVKKHGQPVASEIGRQLWDRASLWRFGWRALYDQTPLPEKELVKQEWDRFVRNEVIPVLEERTDEIIDAQKKILLDLAQNPRLREELGTLLDDMLSDPQLQALVTEIVQEAVIDNRALHDVWVRNWNSQQARAATRLASERLEPVIRDIGDELFGSRQAGIDPDFARVLRNQILGKDRRWVIAVPSDAGPATGDDSPASVDRPDGDRPSTIRIHRGQGPARFPLIVLAASDGGE